MHAQFSSKVTKDPMKVDGSWVCNLPILKILATGNIIIY